MKEIQQKLAELQFIVREDGALYSTMREAKNDVHTYAEGVGHSIHLRIVRRSLLQSVQFFGRKYQENEEFNALLEDVYRLLKAEEAVLEETTGTVKLVLEMFDFFEPTFYHGCVKSLMKALYAMLATRMTGSALYTHSWKLARFESAKREIDRLAAPKRGPSRFNELVQLFLVAWEEEKKDVLQD